MAFDDACHSIDEIENDVREYIEGFCAYMESLYPSRACGYQYIANSTLLNVAIGTNNCTNGGSLCTNPAGNTNVTYEHGQAWAQMVSRLYGYTQNHNYLHQIRIAAANDIEISWNSPANTRAWVDGYLSITSIPYYNFGACEGCPGGLGNGWTLQDVWYVSGGARPGVANALPEIYRTDGYNAYQWRAVSEYGSTQLGYPIPFTGAFTEWQACQQPGTSGCIPYDLDNASSQAVPQLSVEISKSDYSAVRNTITSIKRASDIKWYPQP
jgi:hypothetical protein